MNKHNDKTHRKAEWDVEFVVTDDEESCVLYSRHFDNRADFRAEVLAFVETTGPEETLVISLRGPFHGAFAAPGAADIIGEVLEDVANPPTTRLVVTSESAAGALRPRLDRSHRSDVTFSCDEFTLEVQKSDITSVTADAIVNASNTRLILGSGVSGAIRRAANSTLQSELAAIGDNRSLQPGDVIITASHGLPNTDWLLHAATANGAPQTIRRALRSCLQIAESRGFRSLAIPALGTGTGGLSVETFTNIVAEESGKLLRSSSCLQQLIISLWTTNDFDLTVDILQSVFQTPSQASHSPDRT